MSAKRPRDPCKTKQEKKRQNIHPNPNPQLPNKNINKMSYLKAMTDPHFSLCELVDSQVGACVAPLCFCE